MVQKRVSLSGTGYAFADFRCCDSYAVGAEASPLKLPRRLGIDACHVNQEALFPIVAVGGVAELSARDDIHPAIASRAVNGTPSYTVIFTPSRFRRGSPLRGPAIGADSPRPRPMTDARLAAGDVRCAACRILCGHVGLDAWEATLHRYVLVRRDSPGGYRSAGLSDPPVSRFEICCSTICGCRLSSGFTADKQVIPVPVTDQLEVDRGAAA